MNIPLFQEYSGLEKSTLMHVCVGYKAEDVPSPAPQGALERTEWNIVLPDELVLIGCGEQIDSAQPEKNSYLGRGRTSFGQLDSWTPFIVQEGRTARTNGHK